MIRGDTISVGKRGGSLGSFTLGMYRRLETFDWKPRTRSLGLDASDWKIRTQRFRLDAFSTGSSEWPTKIRGLWNQITFGEQPGSGKYFEWWPDKIIFFLRLGECRTRMLVRRGKRVILKTKTESRWLIDSESVNRINFWSFKRFYFPLSLSLCLEFVSCLFLRLN